MAASESASQYSLNRALSDRAQERSSIAAGLLSNVESGSYGTSSPKPSGTSETRPRRFSFSFGEQLYPDRKRRWTVAEDVESLGDFAMVINLIADLGPAGILPLSYGMLSTGYIPSLLLLLFFALGAGYMMYLIAKVMEISGQTSFDRIWVEVVGEGTAWVPPSVIVMVSSGCCLAYACMFGDLFEGLDISWAPRWLWVLGLGLFPLLPLCMLKDLSALAPTSFGAVLAVVYTTIMMAIRFLDGSYEAGGRYADAAAAKPRKDHIMTVGPSSFEMVNALAVAFLCHYNGCKYYREYIQHRPGRFGGRVAITFVILIVLFASAMFFGYATFRGQSCGVILNNYAADDYLATVARVSMGLANVVSFPLMFCGMREAVLALIVLARPSMQETCELIIFQNILSTVLVTIICAAAAVLDDVSLVVGLVGAVAGSTIIYIIPCFLYEFTMRKHMDSDGITKNYYERILVRGIGFLGCVLAVAGAIATLSSEVSEGSEG